MGENIKRIILKDLDIINRTSKITIDKVIDCDLAIGINYSVNHIPFSYWIILSEYAKVNNILESLLLSMWQKYLEYLRREENATKIFNQDS